MDIVLKTTFNNPRLPVVQIPGFYDDFNRPAADTLGVTSGEGRAWQTTDWPGAPSVWGTNGDGTASAKVSSGPTAALVDAHATRGELSARLAFVHATDRYGGLILRWQDIENYIVVQERTSSDQRAALIMRKDGATSNIQTNPGANAPVSGDTLRAVLDGTNITVLLNDTQILAADVPDFAGASTLYGFYAALGTDSKWDHIRFTPTA